MTSSSLQAPHEDRTTPREDSQPNSVISHSPWYLHSRRFIRTIRHGDAEAQQGKKISPHHRPFTPYVEKTAEPASHSLHWSNDGCISIHTIRRWLRACQEMHGLRCGNVVYSHSHSQHGPFLLIDALDQCLVRVPTKVTYIALSYVWGDYSATSCTTKAMLPTFMEVGGLIRKAGTLPLIVRQALELVRTLGERYLWVDRFCIVQDEHLLKLWQLNAMGQIYANAYFTLVAAQNGNAMQGLYGTRHLKIEDGSQGSVVASDSDPEQLLLQQAYRLMQTPWYSRGWTLQEYLLSRRRVVFQNDTINWECLCSAWNEVHYLGDASGQKIEQSFGAVQAPISGFSLEATPWPNMFRYARLVSLYNRRHLTYPEDVLYAFAGILTHLSRSFPAGFICGIPQMCFDAALLWQPWSRMARRIPVKGAMEPQPPSWSWSGWAGNMNSESWRSATSNLLESDDEANLDQQCSWRTFSTVQWSYITRLGEAPSRVRIPSELANPDFDVENEHVPFGWSTRPDPNFPARRLFYHPCAPLQPFRYPIPIRDQHRSHIPPISACHLQCTTRRGFFNLGSPYDSTASSCPAIDVLTQEDVWAGVLRLNCSRADVSNYVNQVRCEQAGLIELIEISAGEVENQPIEEKSFDEWNKEECPRHQGLYEFVNVLWIKGENGVFPIEELLEE